MELKMDMELKQLHRCWACKGSMDEHEPGCPVGFLQSLVENQPSAPCPECHDGTVTTNADDYFECRKCHAVFNAGVPGPEDPDKTRRAILKLSHPHECTYVQVMSKKGNGNFPLDKRIRELRKTLDKLRRMSKKGR